MANYSASALCLGGRLPCTLREVKALRTEADDASKRAKKYISKENVAKVRMQIVDAVRAGKGLPKLHHKGI